MKCKKIINSKKDGSGKTGTGEIKEENGEKGKKGREKGKQAKGTE